MTTTVVTFASMLIAAVGTATALAQSQPIRVTLPMAPYTDEEIAKRAKSIEIALAAKNSASKLYSSIRAEGRKLALSMEMESVAQMEAGPKELTRLFCGPFDSNYYAELVLMGADVEFNLSAPNGGRLKVTMNKSTCRPGPPPRELLEKVVAASNSRAPLRKNPTDVLSINASVGADGGIVYDVEATSEWAARVGNLSAREREARLTQVAGSVCGSARLLAASGVPVVGRYRSRGVTYGEVRCGT